VAISTSDKVFFLNLMMSDTDPAPQYSITICPSHGILLNLLINFGINFDQNDIPKGQYFWNMTHSILLHMESHIAAL
jgi:hypothetical protein